MIYKVWDSFLLELKRILRKKQIYYLIVILLPFSFIVYNDQEYTNALINGSVIVDIAMFLFMIIGFNLTLEERKYNYDELFYSIYEGTIIKVLGKLILGFVLVLGFIFINIIILFAIYILNKAPSFMYIEGIKYFFLYYFFSLITFFILGMIVGKVISSKMSYIVMFFLWIFMGTLNSIIFRFIPDIIKVDPRLVNYICTLPSYDANRIVNIIARYPLQDYNLMQRLIIALISLTMLLVIYLKQEKRKILFVLLGAIIIICPMIYKYVDYIPQIKEHVYYRNSEKKDVIYYYNYKSFNELKDNNFNIEKCNMNLKVRDNFVFSASLTIRSKQETAHLKFALYHGFKVKSIKDNNKNNLSFNQEGDIIHVKLQRILKKDEKFDVNFVYDGVSSPLFPLDKYCIILPSNFCYYPSNILSSPFTQDDIGFRINDLSYKCNFTVKVDDKKEIFCNLNKKGYNHFEGQGKGITLISGFINKEKYKDFEYYYPKVFENNRIIFEKYIDNSNICIKDINNILNENINLGNNKEMFFLPDDKASSEIKIYNNYVYVKVNNTLTSKSEHFYSRNAIFSDLMDNIVKKDMTNKGFEEKKEFFLKSVNEYYLKNELNDKTHSPINNTIEDINMMKMDKSYTINDNNKLDLKLKAYKKIRDIIEKSNNEDSKRILRELYTMVKKDSVSPVEIYDLIIKL